MKCICGVKLIESVTEPTGLFHPTVDDNMEPLPECAFGGRTEGPYWWRKLVRQMKELAKDRRRPEDCKYHGNPVTKQYFVCRIMPSPAPNRCCPCRGWEKGGKKK